MNEDDDHNPQDVKLSWLQRISEFAYSPVSSEEPSPVASSASTLTGLAIYDEDDAPKWKIASIIRLLVLVGVITILVLFFALGGHHKVLDLLKYVQSHPEGIVIYCVFYVLISVLGVPVSIISIGGGFIFQPVYVAILIVTGCIFISGTIGYLIGKFVIRGMIKETRFAKSDTFKIMEKAIYAEGWKISLLVRLSQVLPFAVGNYILAPLVPYSTFIWTTLVGVMPGLSFATYIGSLLPDLADVDGAMNDPKRYYTMMTVIICCVFTTLVFITSISRRSWRETVRRISMEQLDELDVEMPEACEHQLRPEPFTRNERIAMISVLVLAIITLSVAIPLILTHNYTRNKP